MALPLMPKATAVWLVENTALSFKQIADFCGLHPLEVQAIADEEVAIGIVGLDPHTNGQLTTEEIKRCEADENAVLEMAEATTPRPEPKTKGPRYTPVAKRQERPDAIAWLLRNYPELSDAQISRLVGTTKSTINAVRDRTHWKGANIKPVDPVDIGMCSYEDLLSAVQTARLRLERAEKRATREERRRQREAAKATEAADAVSTESSSYGAIAPPSDNIAVPPSDNIAVPPSDNISNDDTSSEDTGGDSTPTDPDPQS